jgi:hypothetical protein
MNIFQPFRLNIAESPTLSVISGTTTIPHSGWIKVFFQNLAGVNLGSTAVQFTLLVNQGLLVTIPSNMIKSGEIPEYIVIGCSPTNNVGSFVQIAKIKTIDNSGNILPIQFQQFLETDNTFNLSLTAANFASLPNNVPNGKIAIDLSSGTYFEKTDTTWIPFWKGNTYLIEATAVDGDGGYLQGILSLETFTDEIFYEGNSQYSRNFYLGYFNDSSFELIAGTLLGVAVLINGKPSNSLSGKLEIRLRGYVSIATGELDTAPATGYPTILWSGEKDSSFNLPVNVPADTVVLFSIRFNYSDSEISSVNANSTINVDIFLYNDSSVPAEYGALTGDHITQSGNLLKVTPDLGLSLNVSSGQLLINKRISKIGSNSTVSGLALETSGQKLITDVELNLRIENDTYVTNIREAILAIIDTNAYEHLSALLGNINLVAGRGIEIDVTNFVTAAKVRSNYPDLYIADQQAVFNVDKINIYLVYGTTIYKFVNDAINTPIQTFQITTLPPSTPALTTNLDPKAGLFEPVSYSLSSIAGSLPAGIYNVYVSYEWVGASVTKIESSNSNFTIKRLGNISNALNNVPIYNNIKLINQATDPDTELNQIAIYNKGNELYKRRQSNGVIELLAAGLGAGGASYPLGLEFTFAGATTNNNNIGELRFDFNDLTLVYDNLRLNDIFYIHVAYFDSANAHQNNTSADQTELLIDASKAYLVQVNNNTNGTYATFINYNAIYNTFSVSFDVVLVAGKLEVNEGDNLVFQWQHRYNDFNDITETYSTPFTPNLTTKNFFRLILTGNITINEPFNPSIGKEWDVYLQQDSTGSRLLTLDPIYLVESPLVLSTTPNAFDIIRFKCVANSVYIARFLFRSAGTTSGGFTPRLTSLLKTTGQSAIANATNDVTFPSVPVIDENSLFNFSLSPSRLTIQTNGLYHCQGFIQLLNNAGNYVLRITKNGVIIETRQFSNATGLSNGNNEVNKTLYLLAGDYIELKLFTSVAQSIGIGTSFDITRLK